MLKDSLILAAGILSILVGILCKQFYYRKGWFAGDKPAPIWFGRGIFVLVGIAIVAVALKQLLAG